MEPNTKSKQRENKPPLIYFQVPLESLSLTLLDLGGGEFGLARPRKFDRDSC